jgi:hypothetical protein
MEDNCPEGKKVRIKPNKMRGFPELLLLKAGPILCNDKPQKNIKNPNQNCMSGQTMYCGLCILYMLFLYQMKVENRIYS